MTQPSVQPIDQLLADIAAREKSASKRAMLFTIVPIVIAIALVTTTARSVTQSQRELREIEVQRNSLERQRDTLTQQVAALAEQRTRLQQAVTLLVPTSTAQPASKAGPRPVPVTAAATGPRQATEGFAANARYAIGFYALDADASKYDAVRDAIQSMGFVITQGINLDGRPSWLSTTSAVMYYADASAQKARDMAGEMKRLTGSTFEVKRGSGLGVIKGQERWTFFIHWVPNQRPR
jgi:hypothetical protein